MNVDHKEKFINDTCMLFYKNVEGVDISKARGILSLALEHYTLQEISTDVVLYEGESNEKMIKAFLVAKKVNGLSSRTIRAYKAYLLMIFGKIRKRVDEITANDLRIYFAKRELEDKVSDVSRQNERRVLSSFFQWMQDEELITNNPIRRIPKIKTKKKRKEAFSDMEVEKIRQGATTKKEAAIIEILLSTGCRVSELCGIRLDELDGDSVIVHGKGNKDRVCYLTARAQIAIEEYKQTSYFKKRYELGSPYLFARERMDEESLQLPMNVGTVESSVRKIGRKNGVENVHPHRFRRTCATMALKRGMPIEQVSKMLGHESVETTQIYLDLNEETLKTAHKKYVV